MTLYESAAGAVLPWRSIDAASDQFDALPQQSINVCLNCPHAASRCDNCGDWNTKKIGRPRKDIDMELFREMLRLKRCNREICKALGVSERTVQHMKKSLV